MKYILNDDIGLRSWNRVPCAYYIRHHRDAIKLDNEEFELLMQCDGQTELEDSILIRKLTDENFCRPAAAGETLSDWQKAKFYDNRYFPAMNWMITGRCNYNCLHCFNALDNARLQSEFTMPEASRLIEEACDCGINAFTITGGEPMLHPGFCNILKGIYSHEMYVEELNTNGYFLTQDILDEMKAIGCEPLIKISFDGIGHHDWMRDHEGAEKDALRAIKLCVKNGFRVKVQTNVHRLNIDSMLPTAKLMHDNGVSELRIIRTTESPRWLLNAKDACLTIEEYFDGMLQFLQDYVNTDSTMKVDVWQFVTIWPKDHCYRPKAIECGEGEYRDSIPVCRGKRGMVAVSASGNLYPCYPFSSYYEQRGLCLGNAKKDGLKQLLCSGDYVNEVCTTVKNLAEKNEKCRECRWFRYCCGGCRVIGAALTGDKFGCDLSKCLFFNNGYMEKLAACLPGYQNLSPIGMK